MWERYSSFTIFKDECVKETVIRLSALFSKGDSLSCGLSPLHRLHLVKKFSPIVLHQLLTTVETEIASGAEDNTVNALLRTVLDEIRRVHGALRSRKPADKESDTHRHQQLNQEPKPAVKQWVKSEPKFVASVRETKPVEETVSTFLLDTQADTHVFGKSL